MKFTIDEKSKTVTMNVNCTMEELQTFINENNVKGYLLRTNKDTKPIGRIEE